MCRNKLARPLAWEVRENGCWEITSHTKDKLGYIHKYHNGRNWLAHRIVWTQVNGEIPEGMFVCHHCDNPSCVNPEHLFLGTQLDNMKDMHNKKRNYNFSGEKNPRVKLTKEDVIAIRALRGRFYQKRIGEMFGVSQSQVHKIQAHHRWEDF